MDVSSGAGGTIKVNGSAPAFYPAFLSIPLNSTVTLEAVPGPGYAFSHWTGAVAGTANPTSLLVSCDKTVTAVFVPQSSRAATLYFPHVETSLPWQTEIAIINTSPILSVTGTLKAYGEGGLPVETVTGVTLSSRARKEIAVSRFFSAHLDIRSIVFEADSTAIEGYTKFFQAGTQRAAIPALKGPNTAPELAVPHIASDSSWWTQLVLVNTTAASRELTFSFDNGATRIITLAANEHRIVDIARDFFNGVPQPGIHSATIGNAAGILGVELFGRSAGGSQMDAIPLTGKTASTLSYPHVATDGWWTGIVAYNPSAASTITVTPYDASGTALPTRLIPIAAGGKYIGAVADLALDPRTAWFRIDSPTPLVGFELFGTPDNNLLAAYAGGTPARSGVFPKIEKDGWTGIAFVNTEASEARVTLSAYSDTGARIAFRNDLIVPPHAKVVAQARDLFLAEIGQATYIAWSSDRNLAGLQLNGSADGTMLDGLPGLTD